jgi:hypothetical protein
VTRRRRFDGSVVERAARREAYRVMEANDAGGKMVVVHR